MKVQKNRGVVFGIKVSSVGGSAETIRLRRGWGKIAAREMGCHQNTITNILKAGESHPKYNELLKVLERISA